MFYCPLCKKRLIYCGADFDEEVNEYLCGECNEEFRQDLMFDEVKWEFYSYGEPYRIDEDGKEIDALSLIVDE